MSETISVAAVGASYWTYMATVMATRLDWFINKREVTPADIPEGIYNGAKEFFSLVLRAAGDKRPKYPPASINAYVIATDALSGSLKPFPETSQVLAEELEKYNKFVNSLAEARALTEADELETATSLRDFFRALAQKGEAEMYMSTIQGAHLSRGYELV